MLDQIEFIFGQYLWSIDQMHFAPATMEELQN